MAPMGVATVQPPKIANGSTFMFAAGAAGTFGRAHPRDAFVAARVNQARLAVVPAGAGDEARVPRINDDGRH